MQETDLLEIMIETRRNNSITWIRKLVSKINRVCKATGHPQRFEYNVKVDQIELTE